MKFFKKNKFKLEILVSKINILITLFLKEKCSIQQFYFRNLINTTHSISTNNNKMLK